MVTDNTSLDGSVFVVLCDISITQLSRTRFNSYIHACNYIENKISVNLIEIVSGYINTLLIEANKIFGFDDTTMLVYIHRYFTERQYNVYYEVLKGVRECFDYFTNLGGEASF